MIATSRHSGSVPFPEDEGTDLFRVTHRRSSGQQVLISIISVRKNVVTSEWFRCPEMPAGSRAVGVSEQRVAVHLSRLTWKLPGLGEGSPRSFSRLEAADRDLVVTFSLHFPPIDTSALSAPDNKLGPLAPCQPGTPQRPSRNSTGHPSRPGPAPRPSRQDGWTSRRRRLSRVPRGTQALGNTPPGSPRSTRAFLPVSRPLDGPTAVTAGTFHRPHAHLGSGRPASAFQGSEALSPQEVPECPCEDGGSRVHVGLVVRTPPRLPRVGVCGQRLTLGGGTGIEGRARKHGVAAGAQIQDTWGPPGAGGRGPSRFGSGPHRPSGSAG